MQVSLSTDANIPTGDAVSVKWAKDSSAGSYNVTVLKDGAAFKSESVTSNQYTFSTTEAGTYSVKVTAVNVIGSSPASNTVSVTAHNPLNVKFVNYDGSILSEQTVRYGNSAVKPASPVRRGYTFTGWDTVYTKVTQDLVINAEYEINVYTVKFFDVDGSYLGAQSVVFDSSINSEAMAALVNVENGGRAFSGWLIQKASDDSLMDVEHVDCNMELRAATTWTNEDLPVFVSDITASTNYDSDRTFNGYNISFKYSCSEAQPIKAKVVVSLLNEDAEGNDKLVGLSIRTITLNAGVSNADSDSIFVACDGTIAQKVSVSVMALSGADRTGGLLATAKEAPITTSVEAFWGDWQVLASGQTVPAGAEPKIQYRSRSNTKSTTPNTTGTTPSGYTYESKTSAWGSWSAWSDTEYTASSTREVGTQQVKTADAYNQYRYGRYKSTDCKKGTWYHFNDKTAKSSYEGTWKLNYTSWSKTKYSPVSTDWGWSGSNNTIGTGTYKNGKYYWNKYTVNSSSYYWQETKTIAATYKTQYRYRDLITTYKYYKWNYGTWSDWGDTKIVDSDTSDKSFEVETRTLYRVKLGEAVALPVNTSGEVRTVSGVLDMADSNLSGKAASILVYKSRNSDPTESQLEYVGQTTLGENGSYSFNFITKEEPTTETGDFVVALAVEGSNELINVGLIEYERPEYTVTFVTGEAAEDGSNVISTQTVTEGKDAEIPDAPEKAGYVFTGWRLDGDESGRAARTTDIRRDSTFVAVYKPETLRAVFVDYVSQTCEIVKFEAGTVPEIPEAIDNPSMEGYSFLGWEGLDAENAPVDDVIVTAKWQINEYTVTFYDADGNVVEKQTVAYGDAAEPPEYIEVGAGQTFYGWSDDTSWWNVTDNIDVYPIVMYDQTTATPTTNVDDENYGLAETLELFAEEGATIYYTLDGTIPNPDNYGLDVNEDATEPETDIEPEIAEEPEETEEGEETEEYEETSGVAEVEASDDGVTYMYTGELEFEDTAFVRAIAVCEGKNDSEVIDVQFVYTEELENEDDYGDIVPIGDYTVYVEPDDVIELKLNIEDNPGLAGFMLMINAEPSVFGIDVDEDTLEPAVTAGSACADNGQILLGSYDDEFGWRVLWYGLEVADEDGTIVTIRLKVDSEAEPGNYPISVSYSSENTFTEDELSVQAEEYMSVKLDGDCPLIGDVNGDGRVNNADVVRLFRYVMEVDTAGWTPNNIVAANVTANTKGDSRINLQDVLLLARFVAGLEGAL